MARWFNYYKSAVYYEIGNPRSAEEYKKAGKRHKLLERYPDIKSLLAVLENGKEYPLDYMNKLVRLMIEEYQSTRNSLWISLLILTYFPMLARLRGRIYPDGVEANDVDQLIAETFIEIVIGFPLNKYRDRAGLHLRQMTQRKVFGYLNREKRHREKLDDFIEEAKSINDPRPINEKKKRRVTLNMGETKEMALILGYLAEGDLSEENLDLIIATVLRKESLKSYIYRTKTFYGDEEFSRIYQRIKRRKYRVRQRLQELMETPHTDLRLNPKVLNIVTDLSFQPVKRRRGRPRKINVNQLNLLADV